MNLCFKKFPLRGTQLFLGIIVFLCSIAFTSMARGELEAQPNILIILIDDMGWKDFGEAGSTYYETPHIDQLAREGVRFTKGYSAAHVCAPSRAAFLTGKSPARLKMTTVWGGEVTPLPEAKLFDISKGSMKQKRRNVNFRYEEGLHYHSLPLTETTFADVFSDHGYQTGHIGKWHCGEHENFWPDKRGFQYAEGYRTRHVKTPHWGEQTKGTLVGLEDIKPEDYVADRLTDKAVEYIERHAGDDEPFLLVLNHFIVHAPIDGKLEYTNKYKRKPKTDQKNPGYAAMVQSVDESVGRTMQALRDAGIEDDTVVIFTSDNGGSVPNTSNYPLMGGKASMFEAGFRVPFIVRWKGQIKPGVNVNHRVISTDIFPTLLDLAGIPVQPQLHQDGTSFYPLLTGRSGWQQNSLLFHFPHYSGSSSPASAVIDHDWKLVRYYNSKDGEQYLLFNLKEDPSELKNVASLHSERLLQMIQLMDARLKEAGAEMPRLNPAFDPSKEFELDAARYYGNARKRWKMQKANCPPKSN